MIVTELVPSLTTFLLSSPVNLGSDIRGDLIYLRRIHPSGMKIAKTTSTAILN